MEPEAKRRKGCSRSDSDLWSASPVLSDEQTRDVELVEAFAVPIVDKKETSRLVRELSCLYPLRSLQHLKRVRACKEKGSRHPLEILVCLVSDVPHVQLKTPVTIGHLLPDNKVSSAGLGDVFVVRIPACAPLTRPQFQLASKHWPTSFHEDKRVTVALQGALFSPEEKSNMQTYMMAAVTAARAGALLGMEAVGAVVVDPQVGSIVAVGHDCRGERPLLHAVMVCIDLVARGQGGGRYRHDRFPSCQFTPPSSASEESERAGQPYICTGYDLYVTREPCLMCAMALVHSRIGRVFYGCPAPDGALGTKYKIHTHKDLNHRFEVYRGVLDQRCQEVQQRT